MKKIKEIMKMEVDELFIDSVILAIGFIVFTTFILTYICWDIFNHLF